MFKIKVANIIYELNIPRQFDDEMIRRFNYSGPRKTDVYVNVTQAKTPELPDTAVKEMKMRGHSLVKAGDIKYYMQTEDEIITYMKYNKELTLFEINVNEEIDLDTLSPRQIDQFTVTIYDNMIAKAVMMRAANDDGIDLHCVALKHKNEAVIFSAESKTGKTTHTNFWKEIYNDVEIINGDEGLCFLEGSRPFLYGAPWAGKSDDCVDIKIPIKAFVFLEQAKENRIAKLGIPEAFMRLSARCYMPAWENDLMLKSLNAAEALVKNADCYLLKCLPNHDAARLCYNTLFS